MTYDSGLVDVLEKRVKGMVETITGKRICGIRTSPQCKDERSKDVYN